MIFPLPVVICSGISIVSTLITWSTINRRIREVAEEGQKRLDLQDGLIKQMFETGSLMVNQFEEMKTEFEQVKKAATVSAFTEILKKLDDLIDNRAETAEKMYDLGVRMDRLDPLKRAVNLAREKVVTETGWQPGRGPEDTDEFTSETTEEPEPGEIENTSVLEATSNA